VESIKHTTTNDINITDEEIDKFWKQGEMYYEAKVTPTVAFNNLLQTHENVMKMMQLTPKQLYSKLRYLHSKSQPHPSMDCHQFIHKLYTRSTTEYGFKMEYQLETNNNTLECVLYCSHFELQQMQKFGKELVIFDTTHKTNVHNMYLGLFVVINCFGESVIVAKAFMATRA
jgi:hypothetical protein